MDKVDYKEFLYKPNKKNTENSCSIDTDNTTYKPKKMHKHHKISAFNIFVILLVIIIIILCINFATNNSIFDKIQKSIEPTTKDYYLVCEEKYDSELAYRSAYTIRSSGGSGYVYKEDNEFFVVYSIYQNEKSATEVAKKNNSTMVKKLSYEVSEDEILSFCYQTIDDLIKYTSAYELGDIDESKLLNNINSKLVTLAEIKDSYTQTKKNNNLLLLSYFEQYLSNIEIVNKQKIDILSSLRHMTSSLAVNVKNYA